ncbi:MAG: glycosyltransferase [Chloroflexi bacterium]|nr:glycosyltransferase [Chloroflexota bacterium]MCI0578918.1 glycosyltransferase [Chloroflexota bacterium]MCI0647545.1 glycosyltransferase [Chloroflexota bacterium]MCI0730856.1 glycosyltransferase [Chloroflexota bacterium]
MRVLVISSQWPTPEAPEKVPFIVQQVEYLRRAGVEISVFAFRGYMNPAHYGRAWRRLRREYELSQFDLVHAQFGQSGLLALPRRRPLVVTFRGSDLQGIVGANGRYTLAGVANRLVSRFIAYCADERIIVADHLQPYLPAGRRAHVIPGGVDLELFRPLPQPEARRQLGLPEDKRLVLFAADPGRAVKRFHLAEQAISLLPAQLDAALITTAAVPHHLMPVYMNACDALVLTSQHEGSPNVVKEALACNLPVVAVDVGDVRQRLEGLPGCVVCASDEPETIAAALTEVLRSRGRTPGRERVLALDERLVAQKIIAIYEAALAGG